MLLAAFVTVGYVDQVGSVGSLCGANPDDYDEIDIVDGVLGGGHQEEWISCLATDMTTIYRTLIVC